MATFPFPNGSLQTITYRDPKGNTAVMRFYLNANGGTPLAVQTKALAIINAVDNLTNAAIQAAHGPVTWYGVAQYGTAPATYQPIQVKAKLTYQDGAGGLHRFQIPAPIVAMFDADQETVLLAQVAVLNGILTESAAPASGTPYVSGRDGMFLANYLGGVLASTKLRRRGNIYVLAPDLTPGEPEE